MEEKLERPDIVRDYKDSQRYDPLNFGEAFTNRKIHKNEMKSHYLDKYEGLNLNAFGQM